jgi:hypothetical protein
MVGLDIDSPLDGCVDGEGEGGGWMLNHVTQSADNFVQNQQAEIKVRRADGQGRGWEEEHPAYFKGEAQ